MNEYLLNYHRFEQTQLQHSESPQEIQRQRWVREALQPARAPGVEAGVGSEQELGGGYSSLRAPWLGLGCRQLERASRTSGGGVMYSWVRKEERAMARRLGGVEGKLSQKMN